MWKLGSVQDTPGAGPDTVQTEVTGQRQVPALGVEAGLCPGHPRRRTRHCANRGGSAASGTSTRCGSWALSRTPPAPDQTLCKQRWQCSVRYQHSVWKLGSVQDTPGAGPDTVQTEVAVQRQVPALGVEAGLCPGHPRRRTRHCANRGDRAALGTSTRCGSWALSRTPPAPDPTLCKQRWQCSVRYQHSVWKLGSVQDTPGAGPDTVQTTWRH